MSRSRSTFMILILISIASIAIETVVGSLYDYLTNPTENSEDPSNPCYVSMTQFCGSNNPTPTDCAQMAILYYHKDLGKQLSSPVNVYIQQIIYRNISIIELIPTIEQYCSESDTITFFGIETEPFIAEYGPSKYKLECIDALTDFKENEKDIIHFAFTDKIYQELHSNDDDVVTRKKRVVNGYLGEISKRVKCGGVGYQVQYPSQFCDEYNTGSFFHTEDATNFMNDYQLQLENNV